MVNKLYVTNTDSNDISVVDPVLRQEIARFPVGGSPRGAVKFDVNGQFGYVSNCAGDTISKIDLNTNVEVSRIQVQLAPRGLALNSDSSFAFVSNSGSDTLSVVDMQSGSTVQNLNVLLNPRHMGLTSDGNRLLVTEWGSDSVAVFDSSNGAQNLTLLQQISVGQDSRPYSLCINSANTLAYVSNTQADYLSIIDINTMQVISQVVVGFGARASVLSLDGNYLFVSVENLNSVVVVDVNTQTVVHTVEIGPNPRGLVMNPNGEELYVSGFTRNDGGGVSARNTLSIVKIINPLQASLDGFIKVGLGPCSVSFCTV